MRIRYKKPEFLFFSPLPPRISHLNAEHSCRRECDPMPRSSMRWQAQWRRQLGTRILHLQCTALWTWDGQSCRGGAWCLACRHSPQLEVLALLPPLLVPRVACGCGVSVWDAALPLRPCFVCHTADKVYQAHSPVRQSVTGKATGLLCPTA
jgi:hypothetical protein